MSNSNPIGDVTQFMQAAGQDVLIGNPDQAALYMRLIDEEMEEFADAVKQRDDVETLDAIFDTIWVMFAYGISRGWDMYGAWEEGSRSNLSKIDEITGYVIKRPDGKVQKPGGWTQPDFKQFMK